MAEVAGDNEFAVCESKDATPPVNGTEPEAPVRLEKEAPDVVAEVVQDAPGHKRKLEDLEPSENDEAPTKKKEICADPVSQQRSPAEEEVKGASEVATKKIEVEVGDSGKHAMEEPLPAAYAAASDAAASDIAASKLQLVNSFVDGKFNEEKIGHDGEIDMAGLGQLKSGAELVSNGEIASTKNIQHDSLDDKQNYPTLGHQGSPPHNGQHASSDLITSCKVEVPNNKVGVIIGKSGDTIRYLQTNSGAKIQITKDANTDPHSSTRLVELVGTLESISKAEQLIRDVLAESDAGGSPSLVARGFITPGGEQLEIQIPNEKVGVIIGKGGETIKNLQRKSGARMQLLPPHLPDGDSSKERIVRIVGNKKQVESARELIKGVLNQSPFRPSPLSGAHNQHPFRGPRGPPATQWASRGPSPHYHPSGYDHQPRGMYPQPTQYPQSYSGYSSQQQLPPKGWDQPRPAVTPSQMAASSGGYDYYNQGGPAPNTHLSNPSPGPIPASTPTPINYNYGQSQAPDGYGHPAPYAQPPPSQQNYGQGYSEPKYDSQPAPHVYGQQSVGLQPGMYPQQSTAPYGKPAYSAPQEAPPNYNQPRAPQPGDPMYQGPPPSQYPQHTPVQQQYPQQQYPYGTSVPTQQAPPYGQAYVPASTPSDIYAQQPTAGYHPPQGYAGQPAPTYSQPVSQPGGYSQYPSSQASYVDQTAPANANYGYQGGASSDAGYVGNVPAAGYTAPQPATSQPVYSQPQVNPSGYYDPSAQPQSGYGGAPTAAAAAAGYANSGAVAQPGYSGQYDASQMYGHH
ncbi:hypothetical protein KSP40_PGU009726 [Platanthera guangdongensis]|uniref:K Homology domain-containing protein n=1 Tax=Platanthera guangdongensis TaxID=2320717 RepID=A0ABR2N5K7_9ASPA